LNNKEYSIINLEDASKAGGGGMLKNIYAGFSAKNVSTLHIYNLSRDIIEGWLNKAPAVINSD